MTPDCAGHPQSSMRLARRGADCAPLCFHPSPDGFPGALTGGSTPGRHPL